MNLKVAEMTDNLKHILGKIVEKSSWLDDETKNATYNKITKMRSYVSHPYWLRNSTALDAYYQQVGPIYSFCMGKNFLNWYLGSCILCTRVDGQLGGFKVWL